MTRTNTLVSTHALIMRLLPMERLSLDSAMPKSLHHRLRTLANNLESGSPVTFCGGMIRQRLRNLHERCDTVIYIAPPPRSGEHRLNPPPPRRPLVYIGNVHALQVLVLAKALTEEARHERVRFWKAVTQDEQL